VTKLFIPVIEIGLPPRDERTATRYCWDK